ncbi:ParB N-terminal domain-containing protein [Oceanicola sp. S124]|uniref:ParB N-terminal domain-containing protein n=1 Tax=Oceanicola sp. S124 TaxID=1042378 RepID=UPI0002559C8B|nr:ParB N-terminal domain-containing protein [Oceanicola sp. S124]
MAKRKRLTPANPDFLGGPEERSLPKTGLAGGLSPDEAEALRRPRAPIAEVAGEASAAAALKELSDEMTRARDEGRLIQSLALVEIDTGHLVRDRMFTEEEDLVALIESLRRRGQQTPIEVVDRGQGAAPRYGLISGWRRLAALSRLAAEDPKFARVLALVRQPASSSEAYVAMVEENEIRVGLSYYERARVTLKAVEEGVYPDLKTALNTLFANVSRAKRSKIKSFTRLVEALDGALSFPTQIGERLGLELAKRLDEEPGLEDRLRGRLAEAGPANAQEEQEVLAPVAAASSAGRAPAAEPAQPVARRGAGVEVSYDPGRARLVLNGVDADLYGALVAWLGKH